MVGPRFTIEREAWMAVAGADFEVRIARGHPATALCEPCTAGD